MTHVTFGYILLARESHRPKSDICWVRKYHLPQRRGAAHNAICHTRLMRDYLRRAPQKVLSRRYTNIFCGEKFFFKFHSENVELNAQPKKESLLPVFCKTFRKPLLGQMCNDYCTVESFSVWTRHIFYVGSSIPCTQHVSPLTRSSWISFADAVSSQTSGSCTYLVNWVLQYLPLDTIDTTPLSLEWF